MTAEDIKQLILSPELLNKETLYELRNLVARYPSFQTARLLYLKNLYLLHDTGFGEELRKAALYVHDRRALFYLIEGDKYVLSPRQKQIAEELLNEETSVDRTMSLIDSFLATIPEESADSLLSFDVSTDYTAYLLEKEDPISSSAKQQEQPEAPTMKGQELIDTFIENADVNPIRLDLNAERDSEIEPPQFPWETNEDEEGYFTETLARIYIKQKRYSKALEIIRKLSLKYPKKNAYFADQISFLEKLIINAKSK